ncbi:unnamed protein product, partial [Linum tenue]
QGLCFSTFRWGCLTFGPPFDPIHQTNPWLSRAVSTVTHPAFPTVFSSSVGILNLCSSSSLSMVMAATARTVEEIFKDYTARRAGLVRALTDDSDEFYAQCDPEKENLCLYGHPNERWEVTLPADEVPPELPEPVLGINFARDGMTRKDWLSLIAVHGDSWLLSVAFYLGARLNRNDRKRLFSMINDLPTVFEVRSSDGQVRSNPKHENYHVDEDEHMDTLCGSCGGNYNADEFWIGCDICERWFHGKCVKITPAKAETIKQYKCPSCCIKRNRP